MNRHFQCMLWTLVVAIVSPQATAEGPRIHASYDAEGVLVSEGEMPILFYQRATKSLDEKWPRANYVHPLYDLKGNVLTEDFPSDHRHHRGVFWAWHQVWVDDTMLGDAWICRDFVWDVQSVTTTSPADPLRLLTNVHWKSPKHVDDQQRMIPVVDETTAITIHRTEKSFRVVDFEISLLALCDGVRIGGSDDEKGYGGFSPRIELNTSQRFLSSGGEVEPTKKAILAGPWINIVDEDRGLAMISHAKNPAAVNAWILRRQRSMQNAVYPGRSPVPLDRADPTVLRYRLVIHDASLTDQQFSELESEFSNR